MINPILITGCARSGTSMTAGIIDICGAFGGHTSGPNRHNRKGMFENANIRQNIIKTYLKSLNVDVLGQNPLPDVHKLAPISNLAECMHMIMLAEGYEGGPWYYKGAKMCLIWPCFNLAYPKSKWIIVRRHDEDIITSCMKTGFMRAYNQRSDWQIWVDEHKKRFEEMKQAGLNIKEVWPSKFIYGDWTEIMDVIEWLGLEWNMEKVGSFISPELWSKSQNGK